MDFKVDGNLTDVISDISNASTPIRVVPSRIAISPTASHS